MTCSVQGVDIFERWLTCTEYHFRNVNLGVIKRIDRLRDDKPSEAQELSGGVTQIGSNKNKKTTQKHLDYSGIGSGQYIKLTVQRLKSAIEDSW